MGTYPDLLASLLYMLTEVQHRSALAYKPEVFVVAEMLSLAQAHSTRRFMLHETGQEHLEIPRLMVCSPRARVWVFPADDAAFISSYGCSNLKWRLRLEQLMSLDLFVERAAMLPRSCIPFLLKAQTGQS